MCGGGASLGHERAMPFGGKISDRKIQRRDTTKDRGKRFAQYERKYLQRTSVLFSFFFYSFHSRICLCSEKNRLTARVVASRRLFSLCAYARCYFLPKDATAARMWPAHGRAFSFSPKKSRQPFSCVCAGGVGPCLFSLVLFLTRSWLLCLCPVGVALFSPFFSPLLVRRTRRGCAEEKTRRKQAEPESTKEWRSRRANASAAGGARRTRRWSVRDRRRHTERRQQPRVKEEETKREA